MNVPFLDKIRRVRDTLVFNDPMSSSEAYKRLDLLLQAAGTSYEIDGDTLTFKKDTPAAQNRMATFSSGTLQFASEAPGEALDEDDEENSEENEHLPTAAYILAGLFAALYLAGRILEVWLMKSRFRRILLGTDTWIDEAPDRQT